MSWKILLVSIMAVSCFKTAEQAKREQRIENIDSQMRESQNLVADITVILKEMQKRIDTLSGRIDEIQHQQESFQQQNSNQQQSSLKLLEEQIKQILQDQSSLQNQLKAIEETEKKSAKKKSEVKTLSEAYKLIGKKKWNEAKSMLDQLLSNETDPAALNKILHAHGELEFKKGSSEDAIVYFSKIFTKYPKSSLAPSSLYHIALSLKKLKKKEEMTQAFDEFLNLYPDHSLAKKVKEEKKNL